MPTGKVQRWLYELYANFAIFIGVTSYRYDFARRQYKSTKWTQLIASFSNLCILPVILMDLYYAWFRTVKVDNATELTIRLDTTVNDIVCLLRLLQRLSRDRAMCDVTERLRRMRRFYQHRWSAQDWREPGLDHIYLAKNCIIWLVSAFIAGFILIIYKFMSLPLDNTPINQLVVFIYILGMETQDIEMHLHFLLSWHICTLYKRLNSRIKQLIRGNSAVDTLELHHLRFQHWQLAALMHRLTITYKFSLVSCRLTLIVTTAALGYYFSIFASDRQPIFQTLSFGLYAVLALDMYAIDLICDWTISYHRETSWLLRQQDELKNADRQLSRGCELLAVQIACFPLQIKPYGLFAIGRKTWLSNIACIFSWMFVLMQYRIVSQNKR